MLRQVVSYQSTKDGNLKLRLPHRVLQRGFLSLLALGLSGLLLAASFWTSVSARQTDDATATVTASLAPFITVTYAEGVRVRSGPNTLDYPSIGWLLHGDTASAIGRSAAGEWILITYPPAPDGVGWVYAAYVSLSPGFLPLIEPPPTPTPLMTRAIDPTLLAAYQSTSTSTRPPTFTPPPSLSVPTFVNPADTLLGRFPIGAIIILLGLFGVVGLVASAFRRR